MVTLSAWITGPRENKMPYTETSAEHGKLEMVLRAQIIKLIRVGVSEFYTGGNTGINAMAAMLLISIRQEIGTTANLNLVLAHKNITMRFSKRQKDNFDRIKCSADTVVCLNDRYKPGCYRQKNRYMIGRCDYMIGVADTNMPYDETNKALGMAKKKGLKTIIINPLTFDIKQE